MIDFTPPPHVHSTVGDIHRFITDELKPVERDLADRLTNEHLTGEQRHKSLAPMMRGEWTGAYTITEYRGGSDVLGMETRAERRGDEWVIRGNAGEGFYLSMGMIHWIRVRRGVGRVRLFLLDW